MKSKFSSAADSASTRFRIALGLGLGTLLLFSRSLGNDFVTFDDPLYVTYNVHVQRGLTIDSIWWSFTSIDASNWHPLTWLSLESDHEMFGNQAWGYHL